MKENDIWGERGPDKLMLALAFVMIVVGALTVGSVFLGEEWVTPVGVTLGPGLLGLGVYIWSQERKKRIS